MRIVYDFVPDEDRRAEGRQRILNGSHGPFNARAKPARGGKTHGQRFL
jgi:hypothetical protein